ncbi:unnamed protein product [Anisakis simplex]|uniref:Uncharacterized protein n=1 Tax=Anisakis simplex TaxID=6269 RepID=A0A0M3JLZ1_ANISI|nr:unnamed protein product [Anisakis simplex]
MGRSARGSPMRKWMSHVDVKDSSGSSSSITLNNGSKTNLAQSRSNLHTNNAASSIASSTTNLNNSSLHKAKSSLCVV